ncbi:ATP-dependent DNA helicase RecQ-like [Ptychodera flava]|uniref:ATP-dependent DNA helicase RecQ-like n=1 Tax=Ptychodera flava TaxID=63121 RepID=UPI00396A8C37
MERGGPKLSIKANMATSEQRRDYSDALKKLGYSHLKEFQRRVIDGYVDGRDVFVSVPTGSGKSMTYEVAPFVLDSIKFTAGKIDTANTKSIVLVVSPLIALMKEQVNNLESRGIKAVCVTDSESLTQKGIANGNYNILFGSPEAFLSKFRRTLLSQEYRSRIGAIFVDESHCIKKWGKDTAKEKAFRKHYGQLGEIRSLIRSGVPIITLTATATMETRNVITKDLCMKDCIYVIENPNKPNIRYSLISAKFDDISTLFQWLVDDIATHGKNCPRILIFCRKKRHCSELFEFFNTSLGEKGYDCVTGETDYKGRLFGMFHSKTDDDIKNHIISSFQDPDGIVRVVFTTVAFSMGMDVKGVHQVIHYGPSNDLDDYVQETGRAGRDTSRMSSAVLLTYKGCCISSRISKPMKEYCKNNSVCRRQLI